MVFIIAVLRVLLPILFMASFVFLPLAATAQFPDAAISRVDGSGSTHTIVVDGQPRSYILHIPPSHPEHPALVLNLHGGGGTASGWEKVTGMDRVADEHGFIVAYPQGLNKVWNDGGSDLTDGKEPRDDVLFFRNLIDDVASQVPINRAKVFACGLSNGGSMTSRLALEGHDIVSAVAVVGAGLYKTHLQKFPQPRPIPIMFIEGTSDPCFPYKGGLTTAPKIPGTVFKGDHHGEAISNDSAIAFWRKVNGCSEKPEEGTLPHRGSDALSTTWRRWRGKDGNDVAAMIVDGGGHCWPGGIQYFPVSMIGKTTYDFSASEAIWRFFENHGGASN